MVISIDDLASEVMKGLNEYAEVAASEMKKAVKKAGRTAKAEIIATAPKDTGAYAKSWASKTAGEKSNAISIVVYSKNRYTLTHLLEFGHAKRGGGRVEGKPHIEPAKEKAGQAMLKTLERTLK